jgi:3-methyladenine DNA glycosylase/8-oxoguanine DNA glycosylase
VSDASVVEFDPELVEAAQSLVTADSRFAELYERFGVPRLNRRATRMATDDGSDAPEAYAFVSLVQTVVSQQLSGAVADRIFARITTLLDGQVNPQAVCDVGLDALCDCGLSRAKAQAILNLATQLRGGSVRFDDLGSASDDEVHTRVTSLKGFGPWSAHMFLIFHLGRLDIWPVGDLGVRKGYAKLTGATQVPSPDELQSAGEQWRPYRTVAAWYLWRALELP